MIQRIQTVFLLAAAILLVLPVFLHWTLASVGSYELTAISINQLGDGFAEKVSSSFAIAGAMMLSLLLTIYAIMQFKNRRFQVKLVQGALLVLLCAGGLVFYYADVMASLVPEEVISYSPILVIFLFNILLYILAIRGIKKDDALVRSADRLR